MSDTCLKPPESRWLQVSYLSGQEPSVTANQSRVRGSVVFKHLFLPHREVPFRLVFPELLCRLPPLAP